MTERREKQQRKVFSKIKQAKEELLM